MSISLFNAVPAGAIEVLNDATGAPHFKRVDLGRFLGIVDVRHNFKNIATKSRSKIAAGGGGCAPSLLQGQNDHDVFVDLEGALEIVVRSRKPKAVELTKWLTRKGVEKVVEDRQKAIDAERHKVQEKQKAIDEKDMQIALLDDDLAKKDMHLTESKDLVRQLEYGNTGLQGEIRAKDQELAVLRQRHVPLLESEEKNYGITIIAKNDESAEYPFISICGQHGYRRQKKRVVFLKNPASTEFADRDTPNAIVTYNVWREHGVIETDPRKPRDFRLVNIGNEQLLQIV